MCPIVAPTTCYTIKQEAEIQLNLRGTTPISCQSNFALQHGSQMQTYAGCWRLSLTSRNSRLRTQRAFRRCSMYERHFLPPLLGTTALVLTIPPGRARGIQDCPERYTVFHASPWPAMLTSFRLTARECTSDYSTLNQVPSPGKLTYSPNPKTGQSASRRPVTKPGRR